MVIKIKIVDGWMFLVLITLFFFVFCFQSYLRVIDLGVGNESLGCIMLLRRLDFNLGVFGFGLCLIFFFVNFVYVGKIYISMEYKGELVFYDMRLRQVIRGYGLEGYWGIRDSVDGFVLFLGVSWICLLMQFM